jgi:general secretion pathway protein N
LGNICCRLQGRKGPNNAFISVEVPNLTLNGILLMGGAVAARLNANREVASPCQQFRNGNRTDMVKWPRTFGLALLSAGVLVTGRPPELRAVTSATTDMLSSDRAGEVADSVDLGSLKPIATPNREAGKPLPSGNPLWSVPLSVLTATQERPIFSASRRPPQRAVVAPVVNQVSAPQPQKAAEPEPLPLTLIGAVVGDSDAIAVFLDRTNQKIVRLRQGETHAGWVLSSVQGREVALKKADRTEVLVLQRQDGPAAVPGAPAIPGLATSAAGGVDVSYAPFGPRLTPKKGESDGL